MIGVCSYLLIGYWSHRLSAIKSAQKAILVNRVSDGMLLWGILWIWYHLGSLEYDLMNVYSASGFVGLSVLIGAMGKSAQILFHVWLADAMEGCNKLVAVASNAWQGIKCFCSVRNASAPLLNRAQLAALVGMLLGDGSIQRISDGTARFSVTCKTFGFLNWLFSVVLREIDTGTAPTPYPTENPTQWWKGSKTLSFFFEWHKLWYVPNTEGTKPRFVKVLPVSFVTPFFQDPATSVEVLAFWFSGDGYWENYGKCFFFCTDNFSKQEVDHLCNLLGIMGITATPKKRNATMWRIRVSRHSTATMYNMLVGKLHQAGRSSTGGSEAC